MLLKSYIFVYHSSFPDLENVRGIRNYINELGVIPNIAIIDATEDCDFGEKACVELKKRFPFVKCIALIDRYIHPKIRFRYLKSSDFEIDTFPSSFFTVALTDLLTELGYTLTRNFGHLDLGRSPKDASLLSYPFHLTSAEYRILLYLCSKGEEAVTAEMLLSFCFAESYRMSITNVRAHISSINKKSIALGGRKLILSVHGEGYRLNKYM